MQDKLVRSLCDFSYDMATTTEKTLQNIGNVGLGITEQYSTSKEPEETRSILYNLIKDNGCSLTRSEFDSNIDAKLNK